MTKLIHTLNRARLRLGLFRWQNYASIESIHPDVEGMTLVSSYPPGDNNLIALTAMAWVLYWEVHWLHTQAQIQYVEGRFDRHKDAIRHVRRCVKQGIRS